MVSYDALIPRSAVRPDGRVLVVDNEERLRFRDIDVLRAMKGAVIVEARLADGDRVCTTALSAVIDGMQVVVREDGD